MYLNPTFDKEDLKAKKRSKNTETLQTVQNDMIRVICGLKRSNCVNMQKNKGKIGNDVYKSDEHLSYFDRSLQHHEEYFSIRTN